jgi:4a-hydroxytetrahydrobiopterin dehydratase
MERRKLSDVEIIRELGGLPGWAYRAGKLYREFQFRDFVAAFGFMTRAAREAQELDHHPDWHNVYNRVTVELHTHDRGGVTDFDLELARRMSALASASG